MTDVYVAGSGVIPFRRYADRTIVQLAAEAASLALADAGVAAAGVGIGFFANALAGKLFGDLTIGQNVFAAIGAPRIAVVNVENACTSGSTAFYLACLAIRAGETDVALVIGAEKMCVPELGLLNSGNTELDTLLGLVTPASFALRARRHMHEFGTTARQLALVAVKNRRHAAANPVAQFRTPITVDEVLASPMIADPLTRLQACPIADGAAALVLCSAAMARRLGTTVRVRAAVLASGGYENPQDLAQWPTDRRAAADAYAQAGLGPEGIDLVECHDAFSIAEIMHYEALGLCEPGAGGRLVESGATALGGRCPVNASGGLLSRGHPVGATGIAQIAEIADQLRGRAGARQVAAARIGMAHCMGGDKAADTKSISVAILSS